MGTDSEGEEELDAAVDNDGCVVQSGVIGIAYPGSAYAIVYNQLAQGV